MEIIYPPDYKYSLIYFFIILLLSGVTIYLAKRIEKKEKGKRSIRLEKNLIIITTTLILFSCLYFFALPIYL